MPAGTVSLPGPGFIPMALGSSLALATLAFIAWRVVTGPARDEPVAMGHRHIALALLAIISASLLFERAGYLITSALFLFVLLWVLSTLGWWRSALAAVAAAVVSKYFFQDLLAVVLPPIPFTLSY